MFLYNFQIPINVMFTNVKQHNRAILKNYHETAITSAYAGSMSLERKKSSSKCIHPSNHEQYSTTKKAYVHITKIPELKYYVIRHTRRWRDKVTLILIYQASQIHTESKKIIEKENKSETHKFIARNC